MKNVILIDFEPNSMWNFDEILSEQTNEEWKVIKKVSNLNQGNNLQCIVRYLKYFLFPFVVLLKKKKYLKLVAWQQFYGIVFAFYTQLFSVKKSPNIYIMTFIYKEKKGVFGKIYKNFIKYSLESEFVKKIFVFSSSEIDYYSEKLLLDPVKFSYIRLGVEDCCVERKNNCREKFYLSVGRSNRDYEFLINHWNSAWGKLKIITDLDIINTCCNAVIEVIHNCYNDEYYKYLSECYAVLVPLMDENISSGELVVIQAGMFSKPVIATFNKTLQNYIIDGINGYLVSKSMFVECINVLEKSDYKKICFDARKNYEENHSLKSMAMDISKYLK